MDLKITTQDDRYRASCHHLRGGVDLKDEAGVEILKKAMSPPSWWCGFKDYRSWRDTGINLSPPSWWCGFKGVTLRHEYNLVKSPPSWWCGFKGAISLSILSAALGHHLRGGVDLKNYIGAETEWAQMSPPS